MDRTMRAALTAFAIGIVVVGGTAMFLGVGVGPSVISGLVAGLAFGGLILAAARRSQQFHDDAPDR